MMWMRSYASPAFLTGDAPTKKRPRNYPRSTRASWTTGATSICNCGIPKPTCGRGTRAVARNSGPLGPLRYAVDAQSNDQHRIVAIFTVSNRAHWLQGVSVTELYAD